MGAGEEPIILERVVLNNEKTAHDPEGKLQQFRHIHHKKVFLLNLVLLLIVISLTVALIIVGTSRSQSYNLNNEERKDNASSILPAVADTNKAQLPDPCQDDWVWYRQKCYYFSEEDKTWADSLEFCKSQGASLVMIESRKELNFLFRSKYDNTDYWIGLKSTDDNKGWIWVNGTLYTGDIFTVPKFSSKTQYAYLNKIEVKAQNEIFENHWICSKSAFSEN